LPGHVLVWDATGKVTPSGGTAPAAGVSIVGVALQRREIGGQPVEAFQQGYLAGYDVSALAIGASLFAGTNGEIDSAGTVIIGEVHAFGYGAEKMAWIDVTKTWGV
jgi:hypothetical protein